MLLPLALLLLAQPDGAAITMPRAELDRLGSRSIGIRLLGDAGRTVRHHQFCMTIPGSFCWKGRAGDDIVLSTAFEKTAVSGLCASRRYRFRATRVGATDVSVSSGDPRAWGWYRIADRCDRLEPEDDGPFTGFSVAGHDEVQGVEAARFALATARDARSRMAAATLPVDCQGKRFRPTGLCADPAALLSEGKLAAMRSASIMPGENGKPARLMLQLWSNRPGEDLVPVYVDLLLDRLPTRANPRVAVTQVVMREYDFVD